MNMVLALIDEVEKRPVLWNKQYDLHSNRATLDIEWEIVASILGRDKHKVKSKWRNLRDQFLREIKKLVIPTTGTDGKPLISFYRGKWMYFERLLFMKVVADTQVRKRLLSVSEETELDSSEHIKLEEVDVSDNSLSPEYYNYYNNMDVHKEIYEPENERVGKEAVETLAITDCNTISKSPLIEKGNDCSKKRRLSHVTEIKSEVKEDSDIDGDLHFAKSLVPFLKMLTPVKKLMIRNEIQSLLLRELTGESQICSSKT